MIPYPELPVFHVFGQPVYPFTWLIGLGMILCYALAQRRVKAVGLYAPLSAAGLLWVAVGGFVGAHVVEMVGYQPQRLIAYPLSIFAIWEGLSSFGGFIGGTVALYIFSKQQGIWMLPYIDAQMYGFAPGWIIARGGCFASHDHPGLPSDFLLAVAYPGGPRHDLGFYGMLLAAGITLVLYALPRRRRFVGYYTALAMLLYAPVRFVLDFLRTGDARYFGLTSAQYLSVAMVALAVFLIIRGTREGAPMEHLPMTAGEEAIPVSDE